MSFQDWDSLNEHAACHASIVVVSRSVPKSWRCATDSNGGFIGAPAGVPVVSVVFGLEISDPLHLYHPFSLYYNICQ
jgi:hypothetical protein